MRVEIPPRPPRTYIPRSRRDGCAHGFNVGNSSFSAPLTGDENK